MKVILFRLYIQEKSGQLNKFYGCVSRWKVQNSNGITNVKMDLSKLMRLKANVIGIRKLSDERVHCLLQNTCCSLQLNCTAHSVFHIVCNRHKGKPFIFLSITIVCRCFTCKYKLFVVYLYVSAVIEYFMHIIYVFHR